MIKKMKKLIEVVNQYQDADGRVLSEPFYQLPTRDELPDYYEIIRRPVDIQKIENRIESEKYKDMDALEKVVFFLEGILIGNFNFNLLLSFSKVR